MKTNALEGALLNYYVGLAAGYNVILVPLYAGVCTCLTIDGKPFDPANDWAQGGPLLDRFNVDVSLCLGNGYLAYANAAGGFGNRGDVLDGMLGRTRLEAAARAIVAWNYGTEVPPPTLKR